MSESLHWGFPPPARPPVLRVVRQRPLIGLSSGFYTKTSEAAAAAANFSPLQDLCSATSVHPSILVPIDLTPR